MTGLSTFSNFCDVSTNNDLITELNEKKKLPLIGNLVTDSKFRRFGVGTGLMREAEKAASSWQYNHIICAVDSENKIAYDMYKNKLEYDQVLLKSVTHKDKNKILLYKSLVQATIVG